MEGRDARSTLQDGSLVTQEDRHKKHEKTQEWEPSLFVHFRAFCGNEILMLAQKRQSDVRTRKEPFATLASIVKTFIAGNFGQDHRIDMIPS